MHKVFRPCSFSQKFRKAIFLFHQFDRETFSDSYIPRPTPFATIFYQVSELKFGRKSPKMFFFAKTWFLGMEFFEFLSRSETINSFGSLWEGLEVNEGNMLSVGNRAGGSKPWAKFLSIYDFCPLGWMSVHQPVLEVEKPLIRNGAANSAPLLRFRHDGEYDGPCSLQSSVVSTTEVGSGIIEPQSMAIKSQNDGNYCVKGGVDSRSHFGPDAESGNFGVAVIRLCGNCCKVNHSKSENLVPNQIVAQSCNKHFRHQLLSTTQCLPKENQSELSTHLSAENVLSSSSSHAFSANNQNHSTSYVSSSDETRPRMLNGTSDNFVINGHPSPTWSPVCSRKTSQCKCDWIDLNVGGKIFKTTRLTLSKVPGSFLDCLCNNENLLSSHMDASG